ncbi:MAG: acyl-CoA dehydrogenase family protein, partial [Myxococcota bacterium]|nr:acyl-CoA dehydrogenase family protein [Myxococcota bacterium]
SAGGAKSVAEFSARWAKSRVQWGKAIGQHEAGAQKLAELTAGAYAMETLADFGAALADHGKLDLRMEAAAGKLFNTELGWDLMDKGLQLRAGRGYEQASSLERRGEQPFPIERAMRDARINRIVEGTTDVMHLFLAREALDKHLKLALPIMGRGSLGDKLKGLVSASLFYARWYPMLWLKGIFKSYHDFDDRLADHLHWVESRTRKLARALFHRMLTHGPKLEMRQLTLGRLVDIGCELAVMALVACRAQTELNRGESEDLDQALYWLEFGRVRVNRLFRELRDNVDAESRALAEKLMDRAEVLPEVKIPEDLEPMPRERGEDLTSGKQTERLYHAQKRASGSSDELASK